MLSTRGRARARSVALLGRLGFGAFVLLAAVGCFQAETKLSVGGDGSGEIHVTFLMSEQFVAMGQAFESMGESGDGTAEGEAESPEMFPESELRERAAKMGEGVRFVRSERLERDGMSGVLAVYEFDDVTGLQVSLEDVAEGMESSFEGEGMGVDSAGADESSGVDAPQPLAFRMETLGGGVSRLVVEMPPSSGDDEDASSEASVAEGDSETRPDESELAMLEMMFQGMRFAFTIEPKGELVEANTPFVTGNTVRVLEIAFEDILKNMDQFQRLAAMDKPDSFEGMTELLRDVPGIAFPPQDELTIDFRPAK